MRRLLLCVVVMFFLVGVREVIGGGCCQEEMKGVSLGAVLDEVRATLSLTDAQVNTLKAILERHGIREGAHICPMTEKAAAAVGGCCAVKKEAKAEERTSP